MYCSDFTENQRGNNYPEVHRLFPSVLHGDGSVHAPESCFQAKLTGNPEAMQRRFKLTERPQKAWDLFFFNQFHLNLQFENPV